MSTCKKKKTGTRRNLTRRTLTRRTRRNLTLRTRRTQTLRTQPRRTQTRRTRKRNGGACEKGISGYDDNYHCVQAGCDPYDCAKTHIGSKPHKPLDHKEREKDMITKFNEDLKQEKKMEAHKLRRTHRARLKRPIPTPISTPIPTPILKHFNDESEDDEDEEEEESKDESLTAKMHKLNVGSSPPPLIQGWERGSGAASLPNVYKPAAYTPPRPQSLNPF
jgi:hypothetical protein